MNFPADLDLSSHRSFQRIGLTLRSGRAATIPFRRADTTLDPRLFVPAKRREQNRLI
jgi:hypothetical protein